MGFEQAVAKVLDHEGGFVDDPADRGGMTFMGISRVFCQEELGGVIDEDGLTGPATRRAIEALGNLGEDMQEVLPIAYRSLQGVHFLDIYKSNRSQGRFIRGWLLNRAS